MRLIQPSEAAGLLHLTQGFAEDFNFFTSGGGANGLSEVVSSATLSVDANTPGGILQIVTGAADNNEGYVVSPAQFLMSGDKSLSAECYLQFTEANVSDAAVIFGFMDAVAAGAIADGGLTPRATYNGAVFHKAKGSNLWSVEYADGATKETAELTVRNAVTETEQSSGGAAYQRLRVDINMKQSGLADASFWIDHHCVYKATDRTLVNAAMLSAFAGIKAGGANAETLSVDYLTAYQVR